MSTVESIQKLSKFGIFRNYSSTQTQNFGRWNLFYGWNGSGKSTLSALFDALQQRSIAPSSNFADADFEVRTSDGVTLKAANVASCALNIRTFNQRFIRENIDWDKSVKGILLVAKERIDEKTALEALRLAYNAAKERASLDKKAQTELDATIQKFLSDCAKRTKSSFQVIDTSDTRYLN